MIAIALKFPAGRFHATPWGRHVNEGAPEWPPSPWRILRSLVATWKRKLDDRLTTDQMRTILSALAEPPSFRLPPATTGHTRHFMPLKFPDQGDRTKVFDTFVAVPRSDDVRDCLIAVWPTVTLDTDERERLALVLAHVGFLGRAESWCDASLLEDVAAADVKADCTPLNGEPPAAGTEIVRVLCAHRSAAFDNAHTPKIALAGGAKKAKKAETRPLYDPDWHLCLETSDLHDRRWSDPPGSVWQRYVRRSDCFESRPAGPVVIAQRPKPQVARFALDSSVLPLVQQTLVVAEHSRAALMSWYGRLWPDADGNRGRSSVFSGKNAVSEPLIGHGHAYYLPTDEDGDGRIDHLTVYAEDGFGPEELKAIDKLSFLRRKDETAPTGLILLAVGRAEQLTVGPVGESAVWTSATPFIATRHPKARGQKKDSAELLNSPSAFLLHVVAEEVERLRRYRPGLPAIRSITCEFDRERTNVFRIYPRSKRGDETGPALRPLQFRRSRSKSSDDGDRRPAGAFRIEFERPVRGPICLGHSSHFGMGLFVPVNK